MKCWLKNEKKEWYEKTIEKKNLKYDAVIFLKKYKNLWCSRLIWQTFYQQKKNEAFILFVQHAAIANSAELSSYFMATTPLQTQYLYNFFI